MGFMRSKLRAYDVLEKRQKSTLANIHVIKG